MSLQLDPCDLAAIYTIEELKSFIDEIQDSLKNARAASQDSFNDQQAQQTVKRQKLTDLSSDLAAYIKAYNLKTGSECSTINLDAFNYTPCRGRR